MCGVDGWPREAFWDKWLSPSSSTTWGRMSLVVECMARPDALPDLHPAWAFHPWSQ